MLKYLAKIAMDIFPSVLATIIGAYIVNHYINAKPAADAPAVAAAPAEPGKAEGGPDVANTPAPAVKARGLFERSVLDHLPGHSAEKADSKPADGKSGDSRSVEAKTEPKAAEPKSAEPASDRRHQPTLRERAMAKISPATTAPAAAESPAASASEEHRDAAELARAAIERLRKSPEARQQEPARVLERPQETARLADPAPAAPALQPLPPPITVSVPSVEGAAAINPPYTGAVRQADRPTPPAEIPVPSAAPPLDLRADAGAAAGPRQRPNVAEDVLSGVKSMFQAVLPKNVTPD